MLRLKPSELTLTPDDVDETLQRMARRQQSRTAAPAYRRARNSGRPPVPRLVPGAQRSVRDSITSLGHIPILRPPPQQAVVAHVDEDSEASDEASNEPSDRTKSSPDPLNVSPHLGPSAFASSSSSPSRLSTHLPFRLGRPRRTLETEQQSPPSPKDEHDVSDGTLIEPASSLMETTSVTGSATPGCNGPTGRPAATSLPAPHLDLSPSSASLRGGASRSQRNRVRSVGQESLHAPSPLRQTKVPSPAHRPDKVSTDSDEDTPVRYLKGYFERGTHKYTFEELVPRAPCTEPVRRTNQPRLHSRSRSSTDVPPPRFFTPTSGLSRTSSGEDVFWTPAAPAMGQSASLKRDGRPRQHSSEMSNTSLAYSYYELPETRHSSGEHSVHYDGAGTSRETNRGTYRSVRLSEAQALRSNMPRPSTSATFGFTPQAPRFHAQLGVSPVPAEPYARAPGGAVEEPYQPALHRSSLDSLDRRQYPNAISAALENRVSPLEALTTQMGRESQRLGAHQIHHPRIGHFESGHSGQLNAGVATSRFGPYQPEYGSHASPYGPYLSPYGTQPGLVGYMSDTYAQAPMAMADDPYTRGISANAGRMHGPIARPLSAQPVPAADYATPMPRSAHVRRSGQRSSENAPVGFPPYDPHTDRSHVHDQVSAFEQIQTGPQPSFIAQLPKCRQQLDEVLNRRRRLRQQVEAPQAPPFWRNELLSSPVPAARPRLPPSHRSRPRAALSPSQGNAERRSARMDPRLRDQENSGEAEMEMMRQEMDAVRARYDETQQGDVMDETPPRIGRVERHM